MPHSFPTRRPSVLDVGWHGPAGLSTPLVHVADAGTGHVSITGPVNLVAAAIILLVTIPLLFGVSQSASVHSIMVALQAGILLIFVAIGVSPIAPAHWVPFLPPHEGHFRQGWPGFFRPAAPLFF